MTPQFRPIGSPCCRSAVASAVLIGWACAAPADVVQLAWGGKLHGRVIPTEDRNTVTVELAGGGQVTLARRQVAQVIPQSPAQEDYARRAPATPDTVRAQWALAQWCREAGLAPEAQTHLKRVVELDPEHAEARALLGFRRVGDQWFDREGLMAARGLVRYKGDFRSQQEIELLERKERGELARAEWKNNLTRWRRQLNDRDPGRAEEAMRQFQTLKDPAAGPALAALLLDEKSLEVRMLLIAAAGRVGSHATLEALAVLFMREEHGETRYACLEQLAKTPSGSLAAPFVRSLKSNDNSQVNRAAEALELLGSTSAVSPLIDALVTEHKRTVGKQSGGDTYSFNPTSGGFAFGGDGPKVEKLLLRNPGVLSALAKLTGENFGYDQAAWRAWLGARAKLEQVDLRRER